MASNSFDDPMCDVEGWEIANGHQPSPELQSKEDEGHRLGPNCPDLVLKAQQQLTLEANGSDALRCPACLNGFKFLKNLGCQCNACVTCAERMLLQWQDGTVSTQGDQGTYHQTRLCTTCDQEHAVPSLVHQALKPVFGPRALKCMSCQARKDSEDGWWCQDCSAILCSKCAHKSHRDHATVEFDQEYDAVRFVFSMFQMESQETATRFKTMAWAKFEQIFKILEAAIDHELETQNKLRRARLTDVFGHCPSNQHSGDSGYERIHRRLSVIQQRAKQQFPTVLDEILSLAGLGTKESVDLKTEVVAEKIVMLLKATINELTVDDFKLTAPQPTPPEEPEADPITAPIMYVGEVPPPATDAGDGIDGTDRHY